MKQDSNTLLLFRDVCVCVVVVSHSACVASLVISLIFLLVFNVGNESRAAEEDSLYVHKALVVTRK